MKDCDKNWRTWNNMTAHTVELEFIKMFPNHNVRNDSNYLFPFTRSLRITFLMSMIDKIDCML